MLRRSFSCFAASLWVGLLFSSSPVLANNEFCNQELAPLMQERDTLLKQRESIVAQSKKNQGSESLRQSFCGNAGQLIGNFQKVLAYFEKNKDFCGIPDEAVESVKKGIAAFSQNRRQVCSARPAAQQGPAGPSLGGGGAGLKSPGNLRLQ